MTAPVLWPEKTVELGVLVRGVVQLDHAAATKPTTASPIDRDGLVAVLAFCYNARRWHVKVRR